MNCKRPGGKNLYLQLNLSITWFGTWGMKWEAFVPKFENQIKNYPTLDYYI
jgi:hypothetical protein